MKRYESTKRTSGWIFLLLAFGIIISGPRFAGAFAAALGIDLIGDGSIWAWIEIMSGWALAIFEALAFAFIANRFRKIQVLSEDVELPLAKRVYLANAIYWLMLLVGQVFLLISIPTVATVHLATQTFGVNGVAQPVPVVLTWGNIFNNHLTWAWLFVTSASSTLFVFLIGLVMDDFGILGAKTDETRIYEAYSRLKNHVPVVDPYLLSKEADITVKDAATFLDNLMPSVAADGLDLSLLRRTSKNDSTQ
jgi:hypothetical protein